MENKSSNKTGLCNFWIIAWGTAGDLFRQFDGIHSIARNFNRKYYKTIYFYIMMGLFVPSQVVLLPVIGAFGTDDNWLDGWTNFDPNNTDY